MSRFVLQASGVAVVALDSITHMTPEHAGAWVVTGSHGGTSSGEFALAQPIGLVVFNDAGVGRDQAGIAALSLLQAHGVAAATVSHCSARIGDGEDSWASGVVTHVNAAAEALGFNTGDRLLEVVTRCLN
jgi:hypothetical protein